MSPLKNRSCPLAAMCLFGKKRVGKKPKESGTVFTTLPTRALCGMGAHGKVTAAHLQTPRCGATRLSSRQGPPWWHGPFLPTHWHCQIGGHMHGHQPHALPLLLHKATACCSPCWHRCQLHRDGPIGHIFHYIIVRADLAKCQYDPLWESYFRKKKKQKQANKTNRNLVPESTWRQQPQEEMPGHWWLTAISFLTWTGKNACSVTQFTHGLKVEFPGFCPWVASCFTATAKTREGFAPLSPAHMGELCGQRSASPHEPLPTEAMTASS